MIRPARTLAAVVAASAVLSGCATFTQDDVAASFDGAELGGAEFEQRYVDSVGAEPDGGLSGDAARAVVTSWILGRVLDDAGIVETYESGPEASGILCVSLVRPTDLERATELLERLRDGADWFEVVAQEYPEVPDGGDVACIPTATLGPLAPQVSQLRPDAPYEVFTFDDQSVAVLRMRPVGEIDPLELAGIAQTVDPASVEGLGPTLEEAEVVVDPQIGRFDPQAGGVVPLG